MKLLLGIIADDFTGATDIASTLVNQGMRVTQVLGVPDESFDGGDAQAIVIALKSRTNPPAEAVRWSREALRWLRAQGATQIVFKYCSTFDSTAAGNIGPVADALMDDLECSFALVCPAFPDNGRSIYQGHLFVGDKLLSESSMKEHPLTPMRDSSLPRLMQAQSSKRVGLIPHDRVRKGTESIKRAIDELVAQLPVLIYASSTPQEVAAMQHKFGVDAAGEMVESALSEIARKLVAAGFDRLIIAGGETSGAVITSLGIKALRIGAQIDPGVPWTTTLDDHVLALALKSGNFGRDDFFSRAFALLDATPEREDS